MFPVGTQCQGENSVFSHENSTSSMCTISSAAAPVPPLCHWGAQWCSGEQDAEMSASPKVEQRALLPALMAEKGSVACCTSSLMVYVHIPWDLCSSLQAVHNTFAPNTWTLQLCVAAGAAVPMEGESWCLPLTYLWNLSLGIHPTVVIPLEQTAGRTSLCIKHLLGKAGNEEGLMLMHDESAMWHRNSSVGTRPVLPGKAAPSSGLQELGQLGGNNPCQPGEQKGNTAGAVEVTAPARWGGLELCFVRAKKEFLNLTTSLSGKWKGLPLVEERECSNCRTAFQLCFLNLCQTKRPVRMTLLLVCYRNVVWDPALGSYTCSMSAMPSVNYYSRITAFTHQKPWKS